MTMTDDTPAPTAVAEAVNATAFVAASRALEVARFISPGEFSVWLQLAEVMAASGPNGGLPAELINNSAAIVNRMLLAQSLDIPLWLAVQETYVVSNQTGMSAELMRGLLIRSGYRYDIVRADATACTMTIESPHKPGMRQVSWTIDEAQVAGLIDNPKMDLWRKYPADMLVARCTSRLCRRYAPDATKGIGYTREELMDIATEADGVSPHSERLADAVAELVGNAAAEDTTHKTLGKLAAEAQTRGLMAQFTASDGPGAGRRLRFYLRDRWDETAPEGPPAAASAVVPVLGAVHTVALPAGPVPAGGGAVAGLPGIANRLDACGHCKLTAVVANGDHNPGCPQRAAAVPEHLMPGA